ISLSAASDVRQSKVAAASSRWLGGAAGRRRLRQDAAATLLNLREQLRPASANFPLEIKCK
ncbi:MAG: hypothetical protein L0312_31730, partial [Acidobacteria bacterium]|nr:hypothetical protein [Acidobacteriota bacterium]